MKFWNHEQVLYWWTHSLAKDCQVYLPIIKECQLNGTDLLDLDFIGYKADHPLNNKFVIRLISNDFKDNINYICNYIISIIDDLIPQVEQIRYV